ncbi:hypothetical protein B9Z55_023404 [Caenorhabditis nigoni]|uniref:Nematode cuticle collagen N-terminal domain-containing protein n=2 Tax=Caenorhabditis nigoni TaxID=1611254 RepID=A0A2G5SQ91_9PELO|nr:hypothetical protein B9Z55_023404 [Caenorhabditis nigoni]
MVQTTTNMLRFTIISLTLFVCAANANLFESLLDSEQKVMAVEEKAQQVNNNDPQETGVAVIDNDTPIAAAMEDIGSEGQSNGVVIRAKRYYGCGCCGCGVTCATMAPGATMAPCGCGCCGCGYG